jgi:hypothetical protein
MKAAIADAKEPAKKQKLLHHSPGRQTRVAIQPMKIKCGRELAPDDGGSAT